MPRKKPEWLEDEKPVEFDATRAENSFRYFYKFIEDCVIKAKVVGSLRRHGGTKHKGDKFEEVKTIELCGIFKEGFDVRLAELVSKFRISKLSGSRNERKFKSSGYDFVLYRCNEHNYVSQTIMRTMKKSGVMRLEGQALFYDAEILWDQGTIHYFNEGKFDQITGMTGLFNKFGCKVFYE